jgi:hypothetical protein
MTRVTAFLKFALTAFVNSQLGTSFVTILTPRIQRRLPEKFLDPCSNAGVQNAWNYTCRPP